MFKTRIYHCNINSQVSSDSLSLSLSLSLPSLFHVGQNCLKYLIMSYGCGDWNLWFILLHQQWTNPHNAMTSIKNTILPACKQTCQLIPEWSAITQECQK